MLELAYALNIVLPLAEAAYGHNPLLPAGWKIVASIEPDTFGFVAQSDDTTVISFRGTETARKWWEDFDAAAISSAYGVGLVHKGFQGQYTRVRDSVLKALPKKPGKILITGHSLGAALAVLCSGDVAQRSGTPLRGDPPAITTYTWAGPRVGFGPFAHWFNEYVPECYRIVNKWDVVPDAPPVEMGYWHVGKEVRIDGGCPRVTGTFFETAHSLELSYRPGLQQLIKQSQ